MTEQDYLALCLEAEAADKAGARHPESESVKVWDEADYYCLPSEDEFA